jgi:hemerythrin-like domain-containing protein
VQKSIEVLMNEHRLIEQVLGSLETCALEVAGGRPPERSVAADYAAFFRGFADACHHGKEEDILFQRMLERGFSREAGPLAVMYHEHEVGRRHVRELARLGGEPGALAEHERRRLVEAAEGFVPLLRGHIVKEDRVLYPMALRVLTGPELDAIDEQFAAFAVRVEADGSLDRLRALADRLVGCFRPDPARMEEAAHLLPCG